MLKKWGIMVLLCFLYACNESSSGDQHYDNSMSASLYSDTTTLGQKIQPNGYDYVKEEIDAAFLETEQCLGYSNISTDVLIELKEPYKPFSCTPYPTTGCGGLFHRENGFDIITISADFVNLKHEYVHYMLFTETGNPDSGHLTDNFKRCA